MTACERLAVLLSGGTPERPLTWLGIPTHEAEEKLFAHFRVDGMAELKKRLDDDFYPVDVPYNHPPANHIACAFDFSEANSHDYEARSLTGSGCFSASDALDKIAEFPWPDPAQHIDAAECARRADAVPAGKIALGILWSAHFQDACAAFGMEEALMGMIAEPEAYAAVIDRILDFYLAANEIFYRATRGKLHAVLIGNDMGTQNGLMVGPEPLRQLVFPGIRKLVAQAHSYGLKVMYHSCDSIAPVIPDLLDAGVDIIHPVQPRARGMEPETLRARFGDKAVFCGAVDVQHLLAKGTPEVVRREVLALRRLFGDRLILSPSHEALLPDVPPENIAALFDAARSPCDR